MMLVLTSLLRIFGGMLSGEHLTQKTSISSDDTRLDIVAENFGGHNRQDLL